MRFKTLSAILILLFLCSCATVNNDISNSNNSGEDFYTRAITALGTNNYREAEIYFLKSLKAGYKLVGSYYYLGLIEYKLGNLDKSEDYLKKCISLDGKLSDAHNTLGAIYAEKKEYRKAIEEFEIVLKDKSYLFPENALYNLALLHYNLGEYDRSMLYCKKSLKVVPKSPAVYYLIGLNLYKKGLKRESKIIMLNIIKEFPENIWGIKARNFLKKKL